MEPERTTVRNIRHRVNVATSTKGVVTFDCTVEGEGYSQEEILAESDALVAALRERYPSMPEIK